LRADVTPKTIAKLAKRNIITKGSKRGTWDTWDSVNSIRAKKPPGVAEKQARTCGRAGAWRRGEIVMIFGD
jgi:hypothetical protein